MVACKFTTLFGSLLLLLSGCSDPPAAKLTLKDASRPREPDKAERDEKGWIDLTPKPAYAVKASHPAVKEATAFLKALTEGDYKTASAETSITMRTLVSGALVLDEEKRLGYSDAATEAYLRNEARDLKSAELHYQVLAPDDSEVSFRGADGGRYDRYPLRSRSFYLRLVNESGAWKVSRFATAVTVALSIPPGFDDCE